MFGIPTPEDLVGKRVIWHYHPVESLCPVCHYIYFIPTPPKDIVVTVLRQATNLICGNCGASLGNMEGWYIVNARISTDGYLTRGETGVPYTLLEYNEEE